MLATDGLAQATTRNITERADLALGAFHYAFRSKDQMLAAVMQRLMDARERVLLDAANALVTSQPDGLDDGTDRTVELLLMRYWEFVEANPALQLAQHELTVHALRRPVLRNLAREHQHRCAAAVRSVLERAPDTLGNRDPDDVAGYLVATFDGLVLHRLLEDDRDSALRRLRVHQSALGQVAHS